MDKIYEEVTPGRGTMPPPTDFDKFLPWACFQLQVEVHTCINRAYLKPYATPIVSERPTKSRSKSKSRREPSEDSEVTSLDQSTSKFATSVMNQGQYVVIETVYDAHENLVQLKFLNNRAIPRLIMKIIGLVLPFHKHLTSIVINSGLRMQLMYEMSKILPISHITELCLDNTYFIEANYHILLESNSLKHLSLSKCKINDVVVSTIASKLDFDSPASKTLSVLNLSTNRITDAGAKSLAVALRSNRQLSYLNLSDNMIGDTGATNIINSLDKFPLDDSELEETKTKYIEYVSKKFALIRSYIEVLRNRPSLEMEKKTKKKALRPTASPLMRRIKHKDSKTLTEEDIGKSVQTDHNVMYEKAKALAASKLGPFKHPFSAAHTDTIDGRIYCHGNNSLCYLNLAYNNLRYPSIKRLYEVLLAQKEFTRHPRGLINVVIEGNYLPVDCEELRRIDDLLTKGLEHLKRTHMGMDRKKDGM